MITVTGIDREGKSGLLDLFGINDIHEIIMSSIENGITPYKLQYDDGFVQDLKPYQWLIFGGVQ